ncbi:GmrSD restriction endonuclease domain-containing protein [Nocardia wallacei]|uniref:GmrSD restriction endonuclease domain-containing protein n=1 Tax=Nocardia wallacei TaxID=480035 RepID=UPI002454718A|nr:DUF1524 domain-containing protein [Nocardia wallacei]
MVWWLGVDCGGRPFAEKPVAEGGYVEIVLVAARGAGGRSGAADWSAERREQFANDLDDPQLIAVTAASNRAKGDQDPAQWLPPNTAYRCTYARMWVAVKSTWALTLQQSEKDAVAEALRSC